MLGLIVRILLIIAGFIASLFVARDALNFDVIQMTVAVLIFTFLIIGAAFWQTWVKWLKKILRK